MNGKVIEYLLRHYCGYTTADLRDPQIGWKRSMDLARIAWSDHMIHRFDLMFKEDPQKKIESKFDGNLKKRKDGFMELTFEDIEQKFKPVKRGKGQSW